MSEKAFRTVIGLVAVVATWAMFFVSGHLVGHNSTRETLAEEREVLRQQAHNVRELEREIRESHALIDLRKMDLDAYEVSLHRREHREQIEEITTPPRIDSDD